MKANGADPFFTLDRGDNHLNTLPTLLLWKELQYVLGQTGGPQGQFGYNDGQLLITLFSLEEIYKPIHIIWILSESLSSWLEFFIVVLSPWRHMLELRWCG
jgi:hypothetical protein